MPWKAIILLKPTLVWGAEVSHKAVGKKGTVYHRKQFLWGEGGQFEQLCF